jgi:ABC-type phosphate transport system substrate-binding protein
VGAGVLAVVFVVVGGAAVPPSGVNCQADGKISGRGGTIQERAQGAFSAGFNADACGNVPDSPANPGSPPASAGTNMVEYDEYTPGGIMVSGSGYGLKAMACRTDAFGGTDIPYSTNQLQTLDTTVASTVILGSGNTCQTPAWDDFGASYYPPFPPQDGGPPPALSRYPATGDAVAKMMSFPVALSAVAVIANLTGGPVGSGAICQNATGARPTSLNLTGSQLSDLFGGMVVVWDDPSLTSNNPALATDNCAGSVTRVVSANDSGTTWILETYLSDVAAGDRSMCGGFYSWSNLANASPNTTWPAFAPVGSQPGQSGGAGFGCPVQQGYTTGENGTLDACIGNTAGGSPYTGVPGALCYAGLADFKHFGDAAPKGGGPGGVPGCSPCAGVVASIQNATLTSYEPPASVTSANCGSGTLTLPSGTSGAVGLTIGTAFTPPNPVPADWDTWATDNPSGAHGDVTDTGNLYPICGLTFALVYTGLADGTQPNAIAGLTADQRRTLYAYFSYILSSGGQKQLLTSYYQGLPPALLSPIRAEFQRNF